jgi:sphingomyelin phosphodiesterase 2
MIPSSLAHQLITTHGPAIDTWKVLHPFSSVGSTLDDLEKARGLPMPSAQFNLTENGATCDSILNTWRFTKQQAKDVKRGKRVEIDHSDDDPRAKRLDYIFLAGNVEDWQVAQANVGMVERHPDLNVSPSDHFSVEVTINRYNPRLSDQTAALRVLDDDYLSLETYDAILRMTDQYIERERSQRKLRMSHLGLGVVVSIGCLIAVWWSPRNFVSFILVLVSSLALTTGVIDGLIGGLFMSWELRCLREFKWEIQNAQHLSTITVEDIHK